MSVSVCLCVSSAHFVITSTTFTCVKPGETFEASWPDASAHQTVSEANPRLTRRATPPPPPPSLAILFPSFLLVLLQRIFPLSRLCQSVCGRCLSSCPSQASFFAFDARIKLPPAPLYNSSPLTPARLWHSPFASSLRMSCGIVNMSYAL